jgi:hypothetical protein
MSRDAGGKRSSPFDRMLDENRRQFDALMTRRAPTMRPAPQAELAAEPAAEPLSAPPPASASPPPSPAGERFDISGTDIGQTLARRFGKDWRFEIVDKRRDGEDMVVWARLTAGTLDRTRRGRARIAGSPEPAALLGSAGGRDFMLRTDGGGPADPAAAEAAATDEAAAEALKACARPLFA